MAMEVPPVPAADEIVAKFNMAISAGSPLTLSAVELNVLASFVNSQVRQSRELAQMAHIISHRAYGQQSELVH